MAAILVAIRMATKMAAINENKNKVWISVVWLLSQFNIKIEENY